MKKKTKEGNLNLFYMDEAKNKTSKKKNIKKSKKNIDARKKDEIYGLDNEIIIGVNVPPKKDTPKTNKKNKATKKSSNKKVTNKKMPNKKVSNQKAKNKMADDSASYKNTKEKNIKNKKKLRIIKYGILIVILIGAITCFLLSPIFNIKNIKVINNSKFSEDTYISLSKIQIDTNIFNINKREVIKNIKQNAYVEDVQIKRNLPDEILINVKERQATYMIENNGSYIYMNNQGYFLEINDEPLKVPVLKGITTYGDELVVGGRLCLQDLKKMETVLEIISYATSYNLLEKITAINIEDKNNYIIEMEGEKKNVYIGDASNINERIIKIPIILEKEKGNEGNIMINMDLTKKDPYFSPKN